MPAVQNATTSSQQLNNYSEHITTIIPISNSQSSPRTNGRFSPTIAKKNNTTVSLAVIKGLA